MSNTMRVLSLCVMLLVASAFERASAQGSPASAVSVSARVLDAGSGTPINTAAVLDSARRIIARVDDRGEFRLSLPRGTRVHVRALGFHEQAVTVGENRITVLLQPLPTVLATMVTSIGQRVIRSDESPRTVAVIGHDELEATAAVSANQALRQLPGLQEVATPPSRSSIAIRGLDDARVLVLVDGEPVTGALIDSRDIGRLSTLSTERIEVTKGPSSVEFGSDALGGVINLVQSAPTKALMLEGQVRRGQLGRLEGNAEASQTIGRFGYRVAGGWHQLDRLPGLSTTGSTFDRVYDARSDLRFQLAKRLTLRLDGMYSQQRQRWPVDNSFNGFIDTHGGQAFAELHYAGAGGSVRLRAFDQQFHYEYRQSHGLLPIAGSADSVAQRERQQRYLLAYTRGLGAHMIDAGVQYSARAMVAPTKIVNDSASDRVAEVFARDSWNVGPVMLTAGARHTSSTLWGSSTNPSVGFAWQASQSWRVRGNVARGFRAPSFKDIGYTYANPSVGYTVQGNPDLDPETSTSSSVGATWASRTNLVFDGEVYRNDVNDLIDMRYQGFNGAGLQLYQVVNVLKARTQGVETSVRLSARAFDLTVGVDLLRARDLSYNLPLSKRASRTARVQLSRVFDILEGLKTDFSARYTGPSPVVGVLGTGGTFTGGGLSLGGSDVPSVIGTQGALLSIDAQTRLSVTKLAELSVGVNNLLDQRPLLWSPALARQVYAGVKVRWGGGEASADRINPNGTQRN